MKIERKHIGISAKLDYEVLEDYSNALVKTKHYLRTKMNDYIETNKLTPIRDLSFNVQNYTFSYQCERKHKRKRNIEECMKNHPHSVKRVGPYMLVSVDTWVISNKWKNYKELFKDNVTVEITGGTEKNDC
jgi:hypothetical protein